MEQNGVEWNRIECYKSEKLVYSMTILSKQNSMENYKTKTP